MRKFIILLLALFPLVSAAESTLPFMKDLAGDVELPRAWGVSIDYFNMDQDYDIKSLDFVLPGVVLDDPSLLKVKNSIEHWDLQADVWLFPFLNVFGIAGKVNSDTLVDFSDLEIVGLPFELGKLPVTLDGTVLGLGFTLVYGTENWFTAVTSTWTNTDSNGDLDSSIDSVAVQPRVGLIRNKWQMWVGGMYLDADEKHKGVFELPFIGDVPFAVELETKNNWNYGGGARYVFNDRASASFDLGFGKRQHLLVNLNVRF
jgi:hypothetical protein